MTYPRIVETLSPQFTDMPSGIPFTGRIVETASPLSLPNDAPLMLAASLSFSHFSELIDVDGDEKRAFYENECLQGNWSVRELRRQIDSLYYERSGLSKDKKALARKAHLNAEKQHPHHTVRDPYVFEFLGLKPSEVMDESDLESALLDKLEDFLLELGHGFCFEARQKRILIGDELFFVDLVFYNRVLKCHVLIDLKTDGFKHDYLGQLNTYVNWYKKNQMTDGDNPPVGILLCTRKNTALVEYATDAIRNKLFVSRYQLELPGKKQLKTLIESEIQNKGQTPL